MKTYVIEIKSIIHVKAENKAQAYEKIGKVLESHHSVDFKGVNLFLEDIITGSIE